MLTRILKQNIKVYVDRLYITGVKENKKYDQIQMAWDKSPTCNKINGE